MAPSAKVSPCMYCGRRFTKKGVYEHERHSCKHNPNRRKRTFGRSTCKFCGKRFHSAGLRAHVATQHPEEFAREKKRRASSPRDKRKALVRNEAIPNDKARAQPSRSSKEQRQRRAYRQTRSGRQANHQSRWQPAGGRRRVLKKHHGLRN